MVTCEEDLDNFQIHWIGMLDISQSLLDHIVNSREPHFLVQSGFHPGFPSRWGKHSNFVKLRGVRTLLYI